MKTIPLKDYVIIKRNSEEKMAANGLIHIPSNAQEKSCEGVVVAVGKGKVLDSGILLEPSVKVGDKVLMHKHAGIEIKIDNEDLLLIKEDALIAIMDNEE